nr:hypothetical protein [Tanacetum cinerariifolium]
MLVPDDVADVVVDDVAVNDVADVVADVDAKPTPPSPKPTTTPPHPNKKKVEALEQDKIAQAIEITKLKQRVRKLEKKRKLKVFGLKRLRKVGTVQRNEDVTLEEVAAKVAKKDADAQRRQEESQAQVYHIDLEHADKVLSMQDNEPKPIELKEVIKVVTTAKVMTKVVTATATIITVALSTVRRRKSVVIRDPEETATPSTIVYSEPKSKDKGKGILVKEPKPLKKQAQIEQDKEYARELEAKLNANINWDDVIEQHFNSIVGFLEKGKEQLEEEASKALKRKNEVNEGVKVSETEVRKEKDVEEESSKREGASLEQEITQKQRVEEETKELKKYLQIVTDDDADVYTDATPLASKIPIVDYKIHIERNRPYFKIIKADGNHMLCISLSTMLKNFDREDLESL